MPEVARGRHRGAAQRRRLQAGDELDALPPADRSGPLPGASPRRRRPRGGRRYTRPVSVTPSQPDLPGPPRHTGAGARGAWGLDRESRRHARRRGAARDPGRRARPGAGRGRGHDADAGFRGELAVGFLRTEGLIGDDDVDGGRVRRCGARSPSPTTRSSSGSARRSTPSVVAERHFVATASCGICGKASLDEIAVRCDPIPAGAGRRPRRGPGPARALREAQRVFEATGGLHAAGLFEPDGRLVAVREDVGRHNALDKLVGWAVLGGRMPLKDASCSSAAGSASRSSRRRRSPGSRSCAPCPRRPTSPSRPPSGSGQTLIGFLRGDGFNVYTTERLRL